jgi:hypothetical protein
MRRILIPVALIAAACSRPVYTPVKTAAIDSAYHASNHVDTLYARDSIYVRDCGDTVREVRTRLIYRTSTRRDTILKQHTDTITVPVPVQSSSSSSFSPVLYIIVPLILILIIKLYPSKGS